MSASYSVEATSHEQETKSDLERIVSKHLPGFRIIPVSEVLKPSTFGTRSPSARSFANSNVSAPKTDLPDRNAVYYRRTDDDTYVVWVIPTNASIHQPPGPKSVILSRRQKRILSRQG